MFLRWLHRYRTLRQLELQSENAQLFFHRDVIFNLRKGAQIIVPSGIVRIGYDFPNGVPRPSYNKSVITLRENAILSLGKGVHICPGTSIYVGESAKLILKGGNWIGNNCTLFCTRHMELGFHASLSWNVTLIDDDGRIYCKETGEPIDTLRRNMIIEDNVGIQMNVVIPKGVTIGKNALIGANAVVRMNIPENCLAYQNPEMKIRHDTTAGLQNL